MEKHINQSTMLKFQKRILAEVNQVTNEYLPELSETWIRMFGHGNEDALTIQLGTHFSEFLRTIVGENSEKEAKLQTRIRKMAREREQIQLQLKEDIVVNINDNMPLFNVHKELEKQMVLYKEKLSQRVCQMKLLEDEEKQLCEELNESMAANRYDLSAEVLQNTRTYVEAMRELKVNRLESIKNYQEEAKKLMTKLDSRDVDVQEIIDASYVQPTSENVKKIKKILMDLEEVNSYKQKNFDEVMRQLKQLWISLELPEKYKNEFKNNLPCIWDEAIRQMLEETERCKQSKLARIPEITERLRSKIVKYNHKCMKPIEFRPNSVLFAVFVYDENMLRRHETELHHLQAFYEENQEIFMLLHERNMVKERIEAIKNSQDPQARFKNRGGLLLKECNEMKALENKLLTAEIALLKAVKLFEVKNNAPFTVLGEAVKLDNTAKHRLGIKKQVSSSHLRLKRVLKDSTNMHDSQ